MKRKPRTRSSGPVTFDTVREIALTFPGTVESTSYGTPAFKVAKKLFTRLHQDGESLVVRIDEAERVRRMRADPETFFITDHYLNYPWILVKLSTVKRDDLHVLLAEAWRHVAPSSYLVDEDAAVKRGRKKHA
jgi:hypothetical protein